MRATQLFYLRLPALRLAVPVVSALLVWTTVSAAGSYEEASRLFDSGKYLESASLAAKANTAPSLALAARAILTHAVYVANGSRRQVEVEKGAEFARKALTKNSRQVEAHLQLVIVYYQKTRATNPLDAYVRGYAARSIEHLDIARKLEPNNPWAQWLFGGWNFEVVRLSGPILADTLFDANLAAGRAAFIKAISLAPQKVVFHYSFARALLMDDPDANRDEAVRILKIALAVPVINHLDKIMAMRARDVMNAVVSGSSEALRIALEPDG